MDILLPRCAAGDWTARVSCRCLRRSVCETHRDVHTLAGIGRWVWSMLGGIKGYLLQGLIFYAAMKGRLQGSLRTEKFVLCSPKHA